MSKTNNELGELENARETFLNEYSCTEDDVLRDENGEYIMVEREIGDVYEGDLDLVYDAIYLPKELQN